ncbi:DNA-binding MarR family transcriptional regulator [Allocatelliglobosispora scoriae]|uniref:DNA-binding MarR family transcriptional regulator n=1 Tax=Allocatelliglobosispora scoriae TaxID=643052 RepID=A0A841C0H6_9ACTN|nr:MarR family transcriptional regulator [Allocatelliglobosispora scoriae]MBB5872653.1 DNA-binding MarR family transcriptional regulator [Allocatelliglobosispora scoriae]
MRSVDLDVDLAVTVQRLFGSIRRLSPPGLSLTAASTLATLEREGAHRLTELAAKEGVTQPAMTQLVTRLERDALAQRVPDPQDGRVVLVEITQAGRDLLNHRRRARADKVNSLLAELPAADRRAIESALPALNRLADLIP